MGHLLENDFTVEERHVEDAAAVGARLGVPESLQSCHIAVVGGYVVVGHVPADVIWEMLGSQPAIAGLSVPGMPVGSPGMEASGRAPEHYDVVAFDTRGRTSVYVGR